MMLALTVRQPWAYAITNLGKRVENRSWSTQHRGQVALHAGASVDYLAVRQLRHQGFDVPDELPTGAIVGAFDLVDITQDELTLPPWAEKDLQHWRLENVVPLSGRILVGGQRKLWRLPDWVETWVRKEMRNGPKDAHSMVSD